MQDRDSLYELYEIVLNQVQAMHLPMASAALPFIRERFGLGCDVYYRRRISVCRMLIDLHLANPETVDILLAAALLHWLPGDKVPEDHVPGLEKLFSSEPRVHEVLDVLRQVSYADKSYYTRLVENKYALMIRLIERGVLLETLYEWPIPDARRYVQETRESFFSLCIYAKEYYREYLGAASILMEKIRSLVELNEAMLNRYESLESMLNTEILSIREENAAIRSMIMEMKADR